jgi:hypothetical protein
VRRRLEALQHPFSSSYRPVRVLGPIVKAFVPAVLRVRQDPLERWWVAGQLVGDHHPGRRLLAVEHAAQEALGGLLIPALLDQDVEHQPIPIDRSPQPVPLPADLELDLVQVPAVSRPAAPAAESRGERRSELPAPEPDGFVAHPHAPLREHLLHVAVAEREPVVPPHGVADDLRRKAVTTVQRISDAGDGHRRIVPE